MIEARSVWDKMSKKSNNKRLIQCYIVFEYGDGIEKKKTLKAGQEKTMIIVL